MPLLIMLLAAALRFHALARDVRFHPDEALFATFARSAAVQGDWLLHGPLDKPPLTIYADALAMTFFGITPLPNGVLTLDVHAGEFAARLPGTFASILLVAVIYALTRQLYSSKFQVPSSKNSIALPLSSTRYSLLITHYVPLLAAFLAAVSPFALAFSATAFTDGLMLLMLTLALLAASRGRALQAGIWLALGFWCKQQALFYAPLTLALLWNYQWSSIKKRPPFTHYSLLISRYSLLAALPVLLGVALLFVWDAARAQTTSMWALAVANNDPGRLARLDELLPRFALWWKDAQYLLGGAGLTALLLAMVVIGAARSHRAVNRILLAYLVLYGLLNWLIAFNIYDRYLLLLLPPLWLLAAHGISVVTQRFSMSALQPKGLASVALILCCSVLIYSAFRAADGALPVGGDHGENAGIDQLAAYLDGKPLGTIIYDHWLGWELGYYLGTWSDKRRVYYPTPEALAADAILQPDPAPRYFAAPADQPVKSWLGALQHAGFKVTLVYDHAPFVVYELIPPRRVGCASNAESSWPGQIEVFADSCG